MVIGSVMFLNLINQITLETNFQKKWTINDEFTVFSPS